MILAYAIRKAFVLKTYKFDNEEESLENYLKTKSIVNFNQNNLINGYNTLEYEGLSILPALQICNKPFQDARTKIATIKIDKSIKDRIIQDFNNDPNSLRAHLTLSEENFTSFESI